MWELGLFAAGFLLGAIWRSFWALVFPLGLAGWILMPRWDYTGVEVSPWYWVIDLGGPAAAGVLCGIFVGRLARRFVKPSYY